MPLCNLTQYPCASSIVIYFDKIKLAPLALGSTNLEESLTEVFKNTSICCLLLLLQNWQKYLSNDSFNILLFKYYVFCYDQF